MVEVHEILIECVENVIFEFNNFFMGFWNEKRIAKEAAIYKKN